MRRRRLVCDKGQLEVVDDAIDHGEIGDKGDDLHRSPALGTKQRVDIMDLADHLGPAFKENAPERLPLHPLALFLQFDDRTIVATVSFDERTIAA